MPEPDRDPRRVAPLPRREQVANEIRKALQESTDRVLRQPRPPVGEPSRRADYPPR